MKLIMLKYDTIHVEYCGHQWNLLTFKGGDAGAVDSVRVYGLFRNRNVLKCWYSLHEADCFYMLKVTMVDSIDDVLVLFSMQCFEVYTTWVIRLNSAWFTHNADLQANDNIKLLPLAEAMLKKHFQAHGLQEREGNS